MKKRDWDTRLDSARSLCEELCRRSCTRSPWQVLCRSCCARSLCKAICTKCLWESPEKDLCKNLTVRTSPQRERSDTPKVTRRLPEWSQNEHRATTTAIRKRDERVAREVSEHTISCETSFENGRSRHVCAVRVTKKNGAHVWDHLG